MPEDILYGAIKMYQPGEGEGPRVNVDTVLLAHFARVGASSRAVELGCAHGAVALILAARRVYSRKEQPRTVPQIEAVDINPELIDMAEKNAELNGLSGEVRFRVSDIREHRKDFECGVYDAVIMNPPYVEAGCGRPSPNEAMAQAAHGSACSLADVASAAKFLLRNGGKFYVIIRARRAAELFSLLHARNVKPKRARFVHPKPDREASSVLVEAVRASGDGITIEPPLFIYGADGEYTDGLLEAYRLGDAPCRS
ncbi:type 11 methyltransferase [Synergistales bacterium]|nr:type 11 methyltransferase [Synergistales bacterium]